MATSEENNQDPFVSFLVDRHLQNISSVARKDMQQIQVEIGNDVEVLPETEGRNRFKWTIYVRPLVDGFVTRVTFQLHPTFQPKIISLVDAPFEVERTGWGEFGIGVKIHIGEQEFEFVHNLCLSETRSDVHTITVEPIAHEYPRMTGVDMNGMHGRMHDPSWHAPFRVVDCVKEARPGYNSMPAHEYEEDPRTLNAKVKLFCELLQNSNLAMAYTGAGISTASGIDDYASKAKDSKMLEGRTKPKLGGLCAEPSLGHRVLTALWKADLMKHWVQQNHDGLPQKAGFPQWEINEIHGAWFDCSNPVVPMTGTLRNDLCEWMEEWIKKADLTIAMGTSLCGMNADRCVGTVAKRYIHGRGNGAIIVGLQQTVYDESCSLRIYAKIDEIMALVAHELGLIIPPCGPYEPNVPKEAKVDHDIFKIPYNVDGKLEKNPEKWICWNLNAGQKMVVVSGPGEGFKGKMNGRAQGNSSHYSFCTKNIREGAISHGKSFCNYCIGSWWVETAVQGKWHQIPIVNIDPILQKDL